MAKVAHAGSFSNGFSGKAEKMVRIVEHLAASPNSTSTVIINATGADAETVSIVRKLGRRPQG